MESELVIIVSVFGIAWLTLFILVIVTMIQLRKLKAIVHEMQATGRIRVQKLVVSPDKNHAFNNPGLVPDEELSKRGYSMYAGEGDVESGRGNERQTGGQFVEELTREIDHRQQRLSTAAPPFLLNSIENSKQKTRSYVNPNAVGQQGRQSDTNPNFIY